MHKKIILATLGTNRYSEVKYFLNGRLLGNFCFSAIALTKFFEADEIILISSKTEESQRNISQAKEEAKNSGLNIPVQSLLVDLSFETKDVWKWYNEALNLIEEKSTIYADLTHGHRFFSEVFLIFLLLSKNLKNTKERVFYAPLDLSTKESKIYEITRLFDLVDFSSALTSLKTDLNAKQLLQFLKENPFERQEFLSSETVSQLENLTSSLRRTEILSIPKQAEKLLQSLENPQDNLLKEVEKLLKQSFSSVASIPKTPEDRAKIALALTELYKSYGLYMQALTVLREAWILTLECLIHSWHFSGKLPEKLKDIKEKPQKCSKKIKKEASRYANHLGRLICQPTPLADQKKYALRYLDEDGQKSKILHELFLESTQNFLDSKQHARLKTAINSLFELRNAFNHGWLRQKELATPEKATLEEALKIIRSFLEKISQEAKK